MTDPALQAFYEALEEDDAEDLYERAPCGFLSTRPDGTIVKVNQTMCTWTGYRREDLVGRKRFIDLLTPGGRLYHETHYAPMLSMQGSTREIALDIVGAGGGRLPALVNSVLVRDEAGEPALIRAAIFDATERRSYEAELLRAKERAEEAEAAAQVLARTLQQTLIPPATPTIPGLQVAARYRPAGAGTEVGGDFYDLFQIAEGDWMLVLGDVCGKGVEAAVVTALARYTTRGAAVQESDPSRVLAVLNQVLLREGVERFCTVAACRLRREESGWKACVASGGHPLPLLARESKPVEAVGRYGSLLGIFEAPALYDHEVVLDPGDTLVFYTDGVTEARRGSELFGEERLYEAVGEGDSADALADRILSDAVGFQGGDTTDDIAVVVLRAA